MIVGLTLWHIMELLKMYVVHLLSDSRILQTIYYEWDLHRKIWTPRAQIKTDIFQSIKKKKKNSMYKICNLNWKLKITLL